MVVQKRKIIILSESQRSYLDGQLAFKDFEETLRGTLLKYNVRDCQYGLARNIINTAKKYGAVELIVEETGYADKHYPKYALSYKPRKDVSLA